MITTVVGLLSGLWSRIGLIAAAIGAGLAAVAAVYLEGRHAGGQNQRNTDLEHQEEAHAVVGEATRSVAALPDGAAAQQLQLEFGRDHR